MAPMAVSLILIQPLASSLINAISGKRQEDGFIPLLVLPLMIKALRKRVRRAGRGHNNINTKF